MPACYWNYYCCSCDSAAVDKTPEPRLRCRDNSNRRKVVELHREEEEERDDNDDVWPPRTDRDTGNNFRVVDKHCCCCCPAARSPDNTTMTRRVVVPVVVRLPPRTRLRVVVQIPVLPAVLVPRSAVDRTSDGTAARGAVRTTTTRVARCNRTVWRHQRHEGHCLDTLLHRSNQPKPDPQRRSSYDYYYCCSLLLPKS